MSSFVEPVLTSFIAGLGTAVGGALVYLLDDSPSDNSIAFSLSFAGGVMITVSVIDLFLPIASVSWLSCIFALCCVSIGWLLSSFAARVKLPEPEDVALYLYHPSTIVGKHSINGNGNNTTSILPSSHNHSGHSHSTTVQQYIEENTSIGSSLSPSSSPPSSSTVVSGTIPVASLSLIHSAYDNNNSTSNNSQKNWRLGLLLCLVLSIHNFPEGILIGVGIEKSVTLGNLLAAAIWLHNLAEGYVVSLPLFAATKDRKFAFGIAALSGLTEPLGAFIGVFVLRLVLGISHGTESSIGTPDSSSSFSSSSSSSSTIFSIENILNSILCCVGGVMAQVSYKELLPQASKYGNIVTVSFGFVSGVCMILATTFLLSSSM